MASTATLRNNAVFTSAGDRNIVTSWLPDQCNRTWDLIVAYYGSSEVSLAELTAVSDVCFRSTGSKFQNLKRLVQERPRVLDNYDAVWVVDDDIIVTPSDIELLFSLRHKFGLWVCQPSCSPQGRISHPITRHVAGRHTFRYVNFVEVMAPLFDRARLLEFLDVYDGSLVGWGIDWWYGCFFEADHFARMAVIDAVTVINPHEAEKAGQGLREIDRLQPSPERARAWRAKMSELVLQEYPLRTMGIVVDADLLQRTAPADAAVKETAQKALSDENSEKQALKMALSEQIRLLCQNVRTGFRGH